MRSRLATTGTLYRNLLRPPLNAEEASPPPDPARVAAARDLLEVTGVTKQMDGMVEAMSRGFARGADADTSETGKKLSDQFDASMKKLLEYKDQMISDFAELYARDVSRPKR